MTPKSSEAERIAALGASIAAERAETAAALDGERRTGRRYVAGRLLTFGAAFATFVAALVRGEELWASRGMFPALVLFALVVLLHAPVKRRIRRLRRRIEVLDRKTGRLDSERRPAIADPGLLEALPDDPLGLAPEGAAFELPGQVRDDLALRRGAAHLQGLLDTAPSRLGRITLAARLAAPSRSAAEIRRRREAAEELLGARGLRRDLREALIFLEGRPTDEDLRFLREGEATLPDGRRLGLLPWISGLVAIALGSGLLLSSGALFLGGLGLALVANRAFRRSLERAPILRIALERQAVVLGALAEAEAALARHRPEAAALRDVHDRLRSLVHASDAPLAARLRRLRLLSLYKAGLLYVVFDWITFYGLLVLEPLARWWDRSRPALRDAQAALGELEFLCCLARLAEEQRGYVWPEVVEGPEPLLELENCRHPLLPFDKVVPNSLELGPGRNVVVITGSNMAGKSTLIRACGLTVVLAQLGAPVRADRARLTPLALLSDINVRDSLDDGQSYFAVEVGIVRGMLELVAKDRFALLLLDELFRGTNTHEKVAAGAEVTRWIASSGALALVATHDHELTRLERDEPELGIRNAHFSEDLDDGRMVFRYALLPGPATSRNAIRLLAARGFPEELVRRALERSREE